MFELITILEIFDEIMVDMWNILFDIMESYTIIYNWAGISVGILEKYECWIFFAWNILKKIICNAQPSQKIPYCVGVFSFINTEFHAELARLNFKTFDPGLQYINELRDSKLCWRHYRISVGDWN